MKITFNQNTNIIEEKDDSRIPYYPWYNITYLNQINSLNIGSTVDVLGVIHSTSELKEIQTKKGTSNTKREIKLIDSTHNCLDLTLWSENASRRDIVPGAILLLI